MGHDEMKSGVSTSEFAMTAAFNLATILTSVAGHLPEKWAIIMIVAANCLYAINRGVSKIPLVTDAPGYTSTEFWKTALSLGAVAIGMAKGTVPADVSGPAALAALGSYQVSRTMAKTDWVGKVLGVLGSFNK